MEAVFPKGGTAIITTTLTMVETFGGDNLILKTLPQFHFLLNNEILIKCQNT